MNPISIPGVPEPREPAAHCALAREDDPDESFGLALLVALGALPITLAPTAPAELRTLDAQLPASIATPDESTAIAEPIEGVDGAVGLGAPAVLAAMVRAASLSSVPDPAVAFGDLTSGLARRDAAKAPLEPAPLGHAPAPARVTRAASEPILPVLTAKPEPAPTAAAASVEVDEAAIRVVSATLREPAPPATAAPPAREAPALVVHAHAATAARGDASGSGSDSRRGDGKDRRPASAPTGVVSDALPAPVASESSAAPVLPAVETPAPARPIAAQALDADAVPLAAAPASTPAVSRPSDQVTVQFDGEGGIDGRVRVALRGQSLHATIVSSDPAAARRLQQDVGELQQALAERGFTDARIVVQDGRPRDTGHHDRADQRSREDSRDPARHDESRETPDDRSRRRSQGRRPER